MFNNFVNRMACFLPETVMGHIGTRLSQGDTTIASPMSQNFHTVALFADVSGFTNLSEKLAKKGPVGSEELGFYLNRYLEKLVKIINRSGGDVFKFAGDAMLVLWPPRDPKKSSGDVDELKMMVHRATQCCLDIQSEVGDVTMADNVTLKVKLGIGVGPCTILHVGGVYGRLEYLAAGPPLMQAFASEHSAVGGDVILSLEAWELAKENFTGRPVNDHAIKVLTKKHQIRNVSIKHRRGNMSQFEKHIRRYIPAAVIPFLEINEKRWTGELRQVTIVFVNLGIKASTIEHCEQKEELDRIQRVVSSVQASVYDYEGSLNKFMIDDKGSTLITVFGLPPLAHENDPIRALLSCLKMQQKLQELGIGTSIGLTSGLALCGVIGSSGTRREYTVLGDVVNLSARLMQAADGRVLCDRDTMLAADSDPRLKFNVLKPIFVKGKSESIPIFHPYYEPYDPEMYVAPRPTYTVGRSHIIDTLTGMVESMVHTGFGQSVLMVGESGMGKTHLFRDVTYDVAERLRVQPSWGSADNFHKHPFFVWREILIPLVAHVFNLDHQRRAHPAPPSNRPPSASAVTDVDMNSADSAGSSSSDSTQPTNGLTVTVPTGSKLVVAPPVPAPGPVQISVPDDSGRTGAEALTITVTQGAKPGPQRLNAAHEHKGHKRIPSLMSEQEDNSEVGGHQAAPELARAESDPKEAKRMRDRERARAAAARAKARRQRAAEELKAAGGSGDLRKPRLSTTSMATAYNADTLPYVKALTPWCYQQVKRVNPELIPHVYLLNFLLGTAFAAPTDAEVFDKQGRPFDDQLERVVQLVILFIKLVVDATHTPLVLVADQGHSMRSDDWGVTLGVARAIRKRTISHVCLWIGTRPLQLRKYQARFAASKYPEEYVTLYREAADKVVVLEAWRLQHTLEMLSHQFQATTIDPELAHLVHERSGGIPLFCRKFAELLLYVLKAVVIKKNHCSLRVETLESIDLTLDMPIPYRVQRITASFVDRLTPREAMVIKTAAAICVGKGDGDHTFTMDMVQQAHPIGEFKKYVAHDLQVLVKRLNFLVCLDDGKKSTRGNPAYDPYILEDDDSDAAGSSSSSSDDRKDVRATAAAAFAQDARVIRSGLTQTDFHQQDYRELKARGRAGKEQVYAFKYGFIRDVIYQLMLYKQRKRLHALIGRYIDTKIKYSEKHSGNGTLNGPPSGSSSGALPPSRKLAASGSSSSSTVRALDPREFNKTLMKRHADLAKRLDSIRAPKESRPNRRRKRGGRQSVWGGKTSHYMPFNENDGADPSNLMTYHSSSHLARGNQKSAVARFFTRMCSCFCAKSSTTQVEPMQDEASDDMDPVLPNHKSSVSDPEVPQAQASADKDSPVAVTKVNVTSANADKRKTKRNKLVIQTATNEPGQRTFWLPVSPLPSPGPFFRRPSTDSYVSNDSFLDLPMSPIADSGTPVSSSMPSSPYHRSAPSTPRWARNSLRPPTPRGSTYTSSTVGAPGVVSTPKHSKSLMAPSGAVAATLALPNMGDSKRDSTTSTGTTGVGTRGGLSMISVGSNTSHAPSDVGFEVRPSLIASLKPNGPLEEALHRRVTLLVAQHCEVDHLAPPPASDEDPEESALLRRLSAVVPSVHSKKADRERKSAGAAASSTSAAAVLALPLSGQLEHHLKLTGSLEFDIFAVDEVSNGNTLLYVGYSVFEGLGLRTAYNVEPSKLANFLRALQFGYLAQNNAYHNSLHVADVLQMSFVLLHELKIKSSKLRRLDLMALFVAAVIHDFRSPGLTNQCLLATNAERTHLSNDVRVLENHHCTAAFRLMRQNDTNFLGGMSRRDRQDLTRKVIALVLGTSFVEHTEFLQEASTALLAEVPSSPRLSTSVAVPAAAAGTTGGSPPVLRTSSQTKTGGNARGLQSRLNSEERVELLTKLLLKCADVSNAVREPERYRRWEGLLSAEWLAQGDQEKRDNLPVSAFMDRSKQAEQRALANLHVLTTVVEPVFELITSLIPAGGAAGTLVANLRGNIAAWEAAAASGGGSPSSTLPPITIGSNGRTPHPPSQPKGRDKLGKRPVPSPRRAAHLPNGSPPSPGSGRFLPPIRGSPSP